MKPIFLLSLMLILFSGCANNDDDEMILCDTGPVNFSFVVLDQATEENVFASGMYGKNQIRITNNKGEVVEYTFVDEQNRIDVVLGWETKADTYTVNIGEEVEFDIVFRLETSTGGPCQSTFLEDWNIEGAADFERDETSELTQIWVTREDSTL